MGLSGGDTPGAHNASRSAIHPPNRRRRRIGGGAAGGLRAGRNRPAWPGTSPASRPPARRRIDSGCEHAGAATPAADRQHVWSWKRNASTGSDERRRRFRRGRGARRRGRPRRRRRPPGAVPDARHTAHRQPRLLHHRGLARRVARLRRPGHPVLRVGLLRALQGRRRPGLHRRIRRRPHAEPVHALQRADQVRRPAGEGARPGLRRRLHRPLRQGDHGRRRQPANCTAPRTGPRTRATCSAC